MNSNEHRCGVLFVHGIVGNNRIFDFLQPPVPGDCEKQCLVLDGHGGTALDFSKASMKKWRSQVCVAVQQLRFTCRRVVVVAHSMGCLLALDEAVAGRVDALLLLNPPMSIRLTKGFFVNAFKVAVGRIEDDAVALAAKEAYGVSLDYHIFHYYGWPARYAELFIAIRRARRLVGNVVCPVKVFLAEGDEMVSPRSARIFEGMKNVEVYSLPSSRHYYYSADDRRLIGDAFSEIIGQ